MDNLDVMECRRCKKNLSKSMFSKHQRRCRKCLAEVVAEYRANNREKYLETLRKSNRKHAVERRAYAKERYQKYGARRSPDYCLINQLWRKQNPEKVNAKAKVERAVRKGKLVRPDECSICAKTGWIVAHHPDYTKPLEVQWVCNSCHRKIHLGIEITSSHP